jgi:transcriptional regulator with XRE-family HTH domain
MIVGKISLSALWEEYYTNLHGAYNAMWQAFKKSGLSQDEIAERLAVDKGLVSKRLKGRENLTLKTLSFMASAMGCRLSIGFTPYEAVEAARDSMCAIKRDKDTTNRTVDAPRELRALPEAA